MTEHPWRDTSLRFKNDQVLRDAGYRIWSRPKYGQALWMKNGVVFPEKEALARIKNG